MGYQKVKNFCYSHMREDIDLLDTFYENDGHKIILALADHINEYANQIKCICNTIEVLESWKQESFFKLHETSYEINWSGTRKQERDTNVTLPQAQKLYKETRIKYDTLYELFETAARIHYDGKTEELIDKYFTYK